MPSTQANRLLLTDKAVKSLPYASAKPKIIRDTKIAGFHIWVGKTTKTFRLQYETPRVNGQRGTTNVQWLGEHPHHTADEARAKALHIQALRARGEPINNAVLVEAPATTLTFQARQKLSHTGHALRHSFRTLAAAAGIDRLRLKILMNHAIDDDVTDAYANVPALFASLRDAQEQISAFIIMSMAASR